MTNRKTTRRALVLSLLSLLLCCSMLVGTTFAWFTDSVTSGKNRIVAGNLDIELDYSMNMEENSWKSVKDQTDLVDPDALWEPGHTEVVYLRLTNKGTLVLKYNFGITVANSIIGKSVLGNDIELAKYLKYAIIENVTVKFADRDAARTEAEKNAKDLAAYSDNGVMQPNDTRTVALVVYMPETVGNEANYRGEAIPTIDLGVSVRAIQKDAETDSFGPDYDEGLIPETTYVYSLDALKNAIAAGGNIKVMENIQLDAPLDVTESMNLDLSGNAITATGSYALNFKGGNSTVKNGTINAATSGSTKNANCIWTEGDAVLSLYDVDCLSGTTGTQTNFTIWSDGTSVVKIYGGEYYNAAGGSAIYSYGESDVYIYDGDFHTVGAEPWALINDYDNGKNTITVYGGRFLNFDPADLNDNKKGDGAANTDSYMADGYKSVPVKEANGDVWFHVIEDDAAIAVDNSALADAVASGAKTVYLADGDYELKGNQKDGITIVGMGDGVKLSNLTNFAGNGNLGAIWQNVNFENVIFTEKVYTMADGAQSTFKNCTFQDGFRGGYSSGTGVVFDGCTFYANSQGFAMHFEQVKTSVKLTDCRFETGTIAFGNGSGTTYASALISFENCSFSGETSRSEYIDAWASCEFTGCRADKAVEIWLQQPENGETATVTNSTNLTVVEK